MEDLKMDNQEKQLKKINETIYKLKHDESFKKEFQKQAMMFQTKDKNLKGVGKNEF